MGHGKSRNPILWNWLYLSLWVACGPTSDESQVPEVVDVSRSTPAPSETPIDAVNDSEEVLALKAEIAALEERIRSMESEQEQATNHDEQSNALFKEMKKAYKNGDYAQAKVLGSGWLKTLRAPVGTKRAKVCVGAFAIWSTGAQQSRSACGGLDPCTTSQWCGFRTGLVQRGPSVDFLGGQPRGFCNHLLAFQGRAGPWLDRGLQVLSLTRLTKGSTGTRWWTS